jgi:hypothetical protein
MKKPYSHPELELKKVIAAEMISSTMSGDDNEFNDDIWQD